MIVVSFEAGGLGLLVARSQMGIDERINIKLTLIQHHSVCVCVWGGGMILFVRFLFFWYSVDI